MHKIFIIINIRNIMHLCWDIMCWIFIYYLLFCIKDRFPVSIAVGILLVIGLYSVYIYYYQMKLDIYLVIIVSILLYY